MPNDLVRKVFTHPVYFLAFGFGSGLSPFSPGTCGTLVAIPLYYLLQSFSLFNYSLILIAAILIGIWICDVTEHELGVHDYSGIVWDEICGFGLTMWAALSGIEWVVSGFFLFRFFDIIKPWPIAWMNRHLPRGFGVMVDDLMAAVYAWIALHILGYFFFR